MTCEAVVTCPTLNFDEWLKVCRGVGRLRVETGAFLRGSCCGGRQSTTVVSAVVGFAGAVARVCAWRLRREMGAQKIVRSCRHRCVELEDVERPPRG